MSLPPAVEAAERAVRAAQMSLGIYGDVARELTRVEVTDTTIRELLDWARPGFVGDVISFMRGEGPIKIRDVSYYRVPNAPVPWRVIAPGLTSWGKLTATITAHGLPGGAHLARRVETE